MSTQSLRLSIVSFLVLFGISSLSSTAGAATPGTDDASQAAYKSDDGKATNDTNPKDNTNGWTSGDNGGTGFKGWNLVSSDSKGARGFFLGDSKALAGGAAGDINSNGMSFGMFGKGEGNKAEAYRSFDSSLTVGQTFSVEIAVNFRNGQKGLDLRDPNGNVIFNFNVGADDYVVSAAATGNGSTGSDYSNSTVFKLAFTQTSKTGGTWTVTREGGLSKPATGTYRGVADGIKLYVGGTDDGSENDLMANRLSITADTTHH